MRTTTERLGTAARAAVLTATLATGGLVAAEPADAAPTGPRDPVEHCVVTVIGQGPDGQLETTEPACSSTRSAALRRVGVDPTDTPTTVASGATFVIGAHFDGYGYTGSSFSVVGTDCAGGWLNVPAGWNNRISSTLHGCPLISHFDGYYLVVPELQTLAPGANLTTLNNRTSSIQYLD